MEEDSKRELLSQNCYIAVMLWRIFLAGKKHKYLRNHSGLVSQIQENYVGQLDLLLLYLCFSMKLGIKFCRRVFWKTIFINNALDNFSLAVNKSTVKHIKVPIEMGNNILKLRFQDIWIKGQHIEVKDGSRFYCKDYLGLIFFKFFSPLF